ncbi:hypothetical protein CERZMDRAFT_107381 [Cercospora zeae-maydis SCOH1-5]|uniref:DUF1996 domain-containing protein n=1 Tax=Cercospora zeae-maydis SCOH1-5 TaxID=717836 RepID=A0A6A6F816_9PEZI|nr:hypothetical protein CERZMDRAFT_107381 [Cercospora zeae-maydis SCOH1-5]
MKSTFTSVTALALAGNVAAFWRMPCRSHTGIARMDPLVDPGRLADHAHIVFGSGNFGLNSTFESLTQCPEKEYDCTSCGVAEDKSAYWTPPLYFQHANGTVEMVENVGGMLAYYLFYLDDVKPFPEGFKMLAGNPAFRNFTGPFPDAPLSSWPTDPTDQFFLQQRAIGYNCLNYATDPEPSLYRHELPERSWMDSNCKDGLRLEMAFPSCGNGELDSEDHRSHVAYPSLVKEGNCPKGYDVHYPFLFFETIYATQKFAGMDGEFLLSTGDPVGASYHADFMMGWESSDFLGKAIDTCTSSSGRIEDCPVFTLQSDDEAAKCTFPMPEFLQGDDCTGPREGLPVGVPVQRGPEPATKYHVQGALPGGPATSAPQAAPSPPPYQPSADKPPAPAYAAQQPPAPAGPAQQPPAPAGPAQQPPAPAGPAQHPPAPAGPAAEPAVTPAPAAPAPGKPGKITTECVTKGNEVYEYIIEEVAVTVYETQTATASAAAYNPPSYKRHAERHAHQHRH